MGFVKIAHVNTVEEACEIWSGGFLNLSSIDQKQHVCVVQRKIENGSRIFLADGQSFVVFAGDKFVDTVYGPGIFVYLDVFASGECDNEHMKKHTEILKGMKPDAFTDEIPEGVLTENYLFMRQKSKPIPFSFDEATYHDFERNMDIVLQGSGYFVLQEANLRVNYALADFSKEKLLERTLPEFSEEEKKQFALDVENSFEKTLKQVSSMTHFSYEHLPHISPVVTSLVNGELYDNWVLGKGIILKEIQFRTFYPAEKCLPELAQREKARRMEKARAQEQEAQAQQATQAAAQEEAKAAAQAQQQAQQAQQSAGNQQATGRATQTGWHQNTASQQATQYQQNMETQRGCYLIREGNCSWAKGGLNLLNGKATLTNREFRFSSMKFGQLGMVVLNKFTETGSSFQFSLSEVAEVVEAKQGLAKALEFHLKNGQAYKCSFRDFMKDTTDEWLVTIRTAVSNYKG